MHIISSSQINTLNPSQIITICPFHRYTQCIIFSDRHTISSFQIYNYILFTEIHIFFSDKHTISTSQKYTINTLLRNAHYILFSDKRTIFSSQKCTLYPLPGKKLYILHRNTHYILFTEIHIISHSQKCTLLPHLINKHYILFSVKIIISLQINTICPFHKYTLYHLRETLYPLFRYTNYILFT